MSRNGMNNADVPKDAEMNRAGMNGYRTPASKTAKKEVRIHDATSTNLHDQIRSTLISIGTQRRAEPQS